MLLKYSILCVLLLWISVPGTRDKKSPASVAKVCVEDSHPVSFDSEVEPIFAKHCNPCHFPGGKMYDKLPFDQASTIINHQEGILRRIKDSEEVKTIKLFVEENKNSQSRL